MSVRVYSFPNLADCVRFLSGQPLQSRQSCWACLYHLAAIGLFVGVWFIFAYADVHIPAKLVGAEPRTILTTRTYSSRACPSSPYSSPFSRSLPRSAPFRGQHGPPLYVHSREPLCQPAVRRICWIDISLAWILCAIWPDTLYITCTRTSYVA